MSNGLRSEEFVSDLKRCNASVSEKIIDFFGGVDFENTRGDLKRFALEWYRRVET